jgi:hypothetical protein
MSSCILATCRHSTADDISTTINPTCHCTSTSWPSIKAAGVVPVHAASYNDEAETILFKVRPCWVLKKVRRPLLAWHSCVGSWRCLSHETLSTCQVVTELLATFARYLHARLRLLPGSYVPGERFALSCHLAWHWLECKCTACHLRHNVAITAQHLCLTCSGSHVSCYSWHCCREHKPSSGPTLAA